MNTLAMVPACRSWLLPATTPVLRRILHDTHTRPPDDVHTVVARRVSMFLPALTEATSPHQRAYRDFYRWGSISRGSARVRLGSGPLPFCQCAGARAGYSKPGRHVRPG